MEQLHIILQQLTDELEPIRLLAQRFVGQDSGSDPISSAALLSHRPKIAPLAYALTIYPGVDDHAIAEYEDIHRIRICPTYRAVLRKMNGASLFKVSLFGLPPSMTKRPPLLDRRTAWPLDISIAQEHWSMKYKVPSDWFFIGYGPYSDWEHLGYFILPDDRIAAIREGGERVGDWASIRGFLEKELTRAEAGYPK